MGRPSILALAVGWIGLALAAGCHRDDAAPSSDNQGEPPARALPSAITIGLQLRGCASDAGACLEECEAGAGDKCRGLAVSLSQGPMDQRDEPRAAAFYERGCDLGDLPSCVFAGQMYEYHHGIPEDDSAAVRFYTRACDKSWSPGCYNLAIMLENGRGIARDPVRAASLYDVACKAGAKIACDKAANLRAQSGDN